MNLFLRISYALILFSLPVGLSGQSLSTEGVNKNHHSTDGFLHKVVVGKTSTYSGKFIDNSAIFTEGWDTLSHVSFWQAIMAMPHDSMLVNIAEQRQALFALPASEWTCQTVDEKDYYKRMICVKNDLSTTTNIYATTGKKHFFEFRKVLPLITPSIAVFEEEGTDPWFAQTILLIESPGKTEAVSTAGARGAFQLMPGVARAEGLVVSKYQDDRTDLRKSAAGAARLLRRICIPEARRILNRHNVTFDEKDLWFRLLVMHIYHSGAGNVGAAIDAISPDSGGIELIRKLWKTEAKGFKNESQNYSQVALAAMVNFDRILNSETAADTVFLVHGDKLLRDMESSKSYCIDTAAFLENVLEEYGNDLLEAVITRTDYFQALDVVYKKLNLFCNRSGKGCDALTPSAKADVLNRAATMLLVKRKAADAYALMERALSINPLSIQSYNLMISACNQLKNQTMAVFYSERKKQVIRNPSDYMK